MLPVLYGDRLVGRIEPRLERRERALHILGVAFEDGPSVMDDPDLVRALAEMVEAYRTFTGADRLVWPAGGPGRDLEAAVARVHSQPEWRPLPYFERWGRAARRGSRPSTRS